MVSGAEHQVENQVWVSTSGELSPQDRPVHDLTVALAQRVEHPFPPRRRKLRAPLSFGDQAGEHLPRPGRRYGPHPGLYRPAQVLPQRTGVGRGELALELCQERVEGERTSRRPAPVHGRLADPGTGSDLLHRHASEPFFCKQLGGRFQDRRPRLGAPRPSRSVRLLNRRTRFELGRAVLACRFRNSPRPPGVRIPRNETDRIVSEIVKVSIAAVETGLASTLEEGAPARRGPRWGASAGGRPDGPGQLALALILAASFMVVLDFSIVNVALASVQRDLGFSVSSVQWVVTGYAITFGGLLVLGGRAADLFGRRRIFLSGLFVFSLASLSGGLAQSPALLVASRLVQGAGAAMVAPAALSLITTNFKEGPSRNRALGAYGAVASLGFVSGQVLGGVLVDFVTWRSVFLVNVPVGLAVVALGGRVLPESRLGGSAKRLDVGGALLVTSGVGLLVYAVSEAGAVGASSLAVLAGFALAALALAGFVALERLHPAPLVPLRLLRLPNLRRANLLMALMGLWNGGELIVLSLYMQDFLHDSPLVTGLAVAPQGVVGFTAGAFGARLLRRLGIKRLNVLTAAAALAGFLVLTQLPTSGAYGPALAAVTLVGFGTAGIAFASSVEASMGMDDADQGFVGGAVNTSRQIGAAVGASLLPAVAEAVSGHGQVASVAGASAAMLAAAAAAAAAVLVALRAR